MTLIGEHEPDLRCMRFWVLAHPELVWWMKVQAVYAHRIGCSFARAMNDNDGRPR